jgi:hypothetical protein
VRVIRLSNFLDRPSPRGVPPASLASNCLIQNNAGEPGAQAGSRAKISQASEDPHVGFLHGIFGACPLC